MELIGLRILCFVSFCCTLVGFSFTITHNTHSTSFYAIKVGDEQNGGILGRNRRDDSGGFRYLQTEAASDAGEVAQRIGASAGGGR